MIVRYVRELSQRNIFRIHMSKDNMSAKLVPNQVKSAPINLILGGVSNDVNLNITQFPYYPWECSANASARHQSDSGDVYLYWCY